MSYVIACPICGNTMIGPTASPRLDFVSSEVVTKCLRCKSQVTITVASGASDYAKTIPPMVTSKP